MKHELKRLYPANPVGARKSSFGWLAVCACGAESGPFLRTKKACQRWYRDHKKLADEVAA